jgi:hypothetical protein
MFCVVDVSLAPDKPQAPNLQSSTKCFRLDERKEARGKRKEKRKKGRERERERGRETSPTGGLRDGRCPIRCPNEPLPTNLQRWLLQAESATTERPFRLGVKKQLSAERVVAWGRVLSFEREVLAPARRGKPRRSPSPKRA